MGLLGALKSEEELQADLKKVKTQVMNTVGFTEKETDELIARELEARLESGLDQQSAMDSLVRSLRAQCRGEAMSSASTFDGYIIGDRGVWDRTKQDRDTAMDMYYNNPNEAIKRGLISMGQDGKAIVLDNRERVYGRPNQYKGQQPLPHEYQRWLYGVAKKRPDGQAKVFTFQVKDSVATDQNPVVFEPLSFRANISEDAIIYKLNHSNRTRFVKYDPESNEDKEFPTVEQMLSTNVLDPYSFKLEDVAIEADKCKKDWTHFAITVVEVIDVGPVNQRKSIPLTITDDSIGDKYYKAYVPEHLHYTVNFGPGSRIVMTCRPRKSFYGNKETYNFNVEGIYAIPRYINKPGSSMFDK